jgi:ubiquinol-cytochrome c reductase cytochrome c1 subunit
MVRLISFFVGIGFFLALFFAFIETRPPAIPDPVLALQKGPHDGPEVRWAHEGVFGKWDKAQLQRGFQVYKEVCAACHSLKLVSFRTLSDIGFTEQEVKAIASGYEAPTIDDKTGESTTRKALPADYFPSPFANSVQAKLANNGKAPPDLSLIVKARHGGEHYIHHLLSTGYQEKTPAIMKDKLSDVTHYNPYYPGAVIAMAPPLQPDQVTYADGTKATVDQMSQDVTAFLAWTAEPKLIDRKRMGLGVILFLTLMVGITFVSYRRVWKDVH